MEVAVSLFLAILLAHINSQLWLQYFYTSLQRHNTKHSNQIFPKKAKMELRGAVTGSTFMCL